MIQFRLISSIVLVFLLLGQKYALGDTFNNPQIDGYGLDYCREWAQNCGWPAAHAFCKSKGYSDATDFNFKKDNQKTRIINGGQVCDAPYCDRISKVVCK